MHHHIALKWPCLPPASLLASSRTCRHSWVPVDAERALRHCVEPEVVTGEHHRVRLVVRVQDHVRLRAASFSVRELERLRSTRAVSRNFEPILISG